MRIISFLIAIALPIVGFAQVSESYESLLDSAMNASASKQLERAEELYKKVLTLKPSDQGNSLIWGNLGHVQQQLNKLDEALNSYTMALNIEPNLVQVYRHRAEIYVERHDRNRAILDYTAVLDQLPQDEIALVNRANLYMQQRMFNESRMDFERLLLLYPQHRQGELGMAVLCQMQQRYKEAADRFAVLIERYPNDPVLYEARGNMEREAGWYELALIDYEEAGRISRDPIYNIRQAMVYLDQGKKRTARIMIDRAAKAGMRRVILQEFYDLCK